MVLIDRDLICEMRSAQHLDVIAVPDSRGITFRPKDEKQLWEGMPLQ